MKNSKIRIIFDGIIAPFVISFLITVTVSAVYVLITHDLDPNLILVQGIASVFVFAALYPLYMMFKKKYEIKTKDFMFSVCLYMIPLAFSICVIGNVAVDYIPRVTENAVTMEVYKLAEEYNVFLSLFLVSVVIPIVEELMFRGFFYDTVKILSNDLLAIIFTSIAFAVAHFEIRQSIYALFAGLFLAYIKYKYRRLIYTIILHLLMNLTTLVFVPTVLSVNDIRNRAYILFVTIAILLISLYRINYKKNIS